jgi:hypothetical protein
MDLQATSQLLGNFGEFFGAIAVVITLMYLALQVRQAHRHTKADINQRLNDEIAELNRDVYLNPEFATLVNRAYTKSSLDELEPEERQRMSRYFATVLNRGRQIYELSRDNVVDEQTEILGTSFLARFLDRPIFLSAWQSVLRNWYPKDYVDYVDNLSKR